MPEIMIYSDRLPLAGEIIAAAKELDKEVSAVGLNESDAGELAAYGAETIYVLKGESKRPEDYCWTMATVIAKVRPESFLVGATVRGREIGARLAAILGSPLVSEVNRISLAKGALETERTMYGGAAVLTETVGGFAVITISGGKHQSSREEGRSAEIVTVAADIDTRVTQVRVEPIVREGADITKAARIVCVGMGFDKKDDLAIARGLAAALGGEIAATRPITEDRKWLPAETYVGISGAVIRPNLYIGLGVSGQIQHTYGIRDAKIVAAVNNNERATIFQAADYAIVGDLYEIAPLLTEMIGRAG